MVQVVVVVAAALLALVGEVAGQADPPTPVAQLRRGQTVRVRLAHGPRLERRFVSVDSTPPSSMYLSQPDLVIPLTAIDSLWVKGRATLTGAIVGGLVLGGLSFGTGAVVCAAVHQGGECQDWGVVWGVALAGTAGGALFGAALGRLVVKWRLIHPGRAGVSLGLRSVGPVVAVRMRF